jgi:hypothetical protein
MADVLLAPYLPLDEEVTLGPWILVPFDDLAYRHTRDRSIFNEIRRLRTAYQLPTDGMPYGAVFLPHGGRLGDDFSRDEVRPLHRAVVAALIDGNPTLLESDGDPNAGDRMVTSENGLIYGHPIHGGGSYVISTGAMSRQLSLRYAEPGRRVPKIAPPSELMTPLFGRFDYEYASALHGLLTKGDTQARRLDRAIEWLALAWNNSALISEDARVLAFRAAFEVLLGGGSSTTQNRGLLSRLLDAPDAPRTPRSWPRGPRQPVPLTPLEWWFQCFALLRNKVAHGDVIEESDWLFEDSKRHVWHADGVLRRSIKRMVVQSVDDSSLELPMVDRAFRRAAEEALLALTSERKHDAVEDSVEEDGQAT